MEVVSVGEDYRASLTCACDPALSVSSLRVQAEDAIVAVVAHWNGCREREASPVTSSTLGYAEHFKSWGLPLDRGISYAVKVLRDGGIETFESCEGGEGHAFHEPTVRFNGQPAAGYKAMGVALDHGLPVVSVRRAWSMQSGELVGPEWEMTFSAPRLADVQRDAEKAGLIS